MGDDRSTTDGVDGLIDGLDQHLVWLIADCNGNIFCCVQQQMTMVPVFITQLVKL